MTYCVLEGVLELKHLPLRVSSKGQGEGEGKRKKSKMGRDRWSLSNITVGPFLYSFFVKKRFVWLLSKR